MRAVTQATGIALVLGTLVVSAAFSDQPGLLTAAFGRQSEAGTVIDFHRAAPAGGMAVVRLHFGSVQLAATTGKRTHFWPQELADIAAAGRDLPVTVSAMPGTQAGRLKTHFPVLLPLTRAPPC